MGKNVYIAYALWFLLAPIGSGFHRIYCGKFVSGFLQLGLFWLGQITVGILIGWVFLFIWALWWIADVFLTASMVESANLDSTYEKEMINRSKIKQVEELYELLQKGAISQAEYEARKEIIMRS